jgi:hypothetical protein
VRTDLLIQSSLPALVVLSWTNHSSLCWCALIYCAGRHKDLYPGGAPEHPGDAGGGMCYVLLSRVALGYTLRTKGAPYALPTDGDS